MAGKQPAKLERSLSLTSEPRTLTKEQYEFARAVASMQAFESKTSSTGSNEAETDGANGKADRDGGSPAGAPVKLPA